MKKIAFLLIFFISSCGYQAIYQNDNIKNFKFYKIKIEGEKEINRNIINSISLEEDQTNELLNELLLKSSFEVKGTSKNKKGQINSYRSSILINLSIIINIMPLIPSGSFFNNWICLMIFFPIGFLLYLKDKIRT